MVHVPSRLTINGRVYYNSARPEPVVRFTRRVKVDGEWTEEPIDTSPIPPDHVDSPLRIGSPWTDPTEGVTYQVSQYLDPLEGWAPAEWWMKRHAVAHRLILKWCLMGYLQAGMEPRSPTKRYRCPNEDRLFDYMIEHVHARQGRAQVYRPRRDKATTGG